MSEEGFVPWSERGDDDNVDDFIAMMADVNENEHRRKRYCRRHC